MTKWHTLETLAGEKIVLSGHAQDRYKEYFCDKNPESPVLSDADTRFELWMRIEVMEGVELSPFDRVYQSRQHRFKARFMTDGEFVFVFREAPDALIMVTLYFLDGWSVQ